MIIALFTALLLVASVLSSPIDGPHSFLVYSPRITSPTSRSAWRVGSIQNITWDTSKIPAEKHSSTGLILLGHISNGSENLDINHPLASQFPLMAGFATIKVPNVGTRNDYVVVLFGDSGNKSPQFTITTPQSITQPRTNHTS